MAKPGKFSQSAPFRALMAEFAIEFVPDEDSDPVLIHTVCDMPVRDNVTDMDLAVMLQAAIDHDCD